MITKKGSGFGMNLVNSYMSHFGGRIHVTSSAIEENKDQAWHKKVDLVFVSVAASELDKQNFLLAC